MATTTLLGVVLLAIALYATRVFLFQKKPPGPLPPGPAGKPIVGNISDLPPPGTQDWMHWLKHKEQYGMRPMDGETIKVECILMLIHRANQFNYCHGANHRDPQ